MEDPRKLGVRVVCISDTHGDHEKMVLPSGDILIHAGDFTRFGRADHAEKFNSWLAEQKMKGNFQHVIVVNGNHETNVCPLDCLQIAQIPETGYDSRPSAGPLARQSRGYPLQRHIPKES